MRKFPKIISCLFLSTLSVSLNAQQIPINQTFSADTAIKPFSGNVSLYSIKLNCQVELLSDSSLVRVVMIDTSSNHYLVYESYPLITFSRNYTAEEVCDETCFMNGIVADSLRIDLINAVVTIDTLSIDTGYNANATTLQAQAKWLTDSIKIVTMNQQVAKAKMYWRAGRTPVTGSSFMEKEKIFGRKMNLAGFDYYKGGIFEFLYRRPNSPGCFTSNIVNEFDWRTRHDAMSSASKYFNPDGDGWITKPQYQSSCNSCYVFSATHTFADFMNIHANKFYNYNLSEEEALICSASDSNYLCGSCNLGGSSSCVLDYIRYHMIHKDSSCSTYMTNPPPSCNTACLNDTSFTFTGRYSALFTEDQYRIALITRGPIASGLDNTIFPPLGHAMEIIGYKKLQIGDSVHISPDSVIPINSTSNLIGRIAWTFKNSLDPSEYFTFCADTIPFIGNRDALIGPVKMTVGSVTDTLKPVCLDKDDDGYYWWGVSRDLGWTPISPQLCGCPPGVMADQEDCNDNDPLVGPYVTNPADSLPLYTCRPNDCITRSDTLSIGGDSIWTTYRYIDRNVVIQGGGTLTVTTQVFLSPGAKIIIKPNGKLNLVSADTANPARLTSGCGHMWGGIELWGNPLDPQQPQYQGMITIVNGVIEHASCGIRTLIPDYYPDGGGEPVSVGMPTGGIVQATAAIFRNNVVGVELCPYRDSTHANLSYFIACRFETTEALYDNLRPVYGIKLSGVNNVDIKACTFINCRPDTVGYAERGGGLYVYNAQCKVGGNTTLFGKTFTTDFSTLHHGIYAMKSPAGAAEINVVNAAFNSNFGGIYLSGFQGNSLVTLKQNTFTLLYNYDNDKQYGIYLGNCSGYKVSLNHVTGNNSAGGEQFGIIVNNSGPENNYIYKNYFQNLKVGIQGFNINRNSDALIEGGVPVFIPTGLRFICNKFHNAGCTNDFLINEDMAYPPTRPGIAYNQRNASNTTNPTQEPAGNVFTSSHTLANTNDYDINISSSVGDILYTHHTSSFPQGLRLEPNDVSNPDIVGYDAKLLTYTEEQSCPDDFYPEGDRAELRSDLCEAGQKIDSLISLIKTLVDDGSTDTLKSSIENSTSGQSYEIYQELMNGSPYLSDTVVKTSIEKEDVLPNAMIRDIMVVNPQSAKNEELLDAIDQRNNPMPDSMWVDILQGMDTVGAMERLIGELDGWIQKRDLCFHALAELFLFDSIHDWAPDSLINLFESDEQLSSHYLLVHYYLNNLNFSEAGSELQAISSVFDLNERQSATHQKILSLVSVLPALFHDTTGFLVPDSTQQQTLEQIAEADHDLPGAWARNFLIASGLLNYNEPIVNESTLKSSRKGKYHWTRSRTIASELKVFPNPAEDYIIVEYAQKKHADAVDLELFNSHGIKLQTYKLTKGIDQKIIYTGNLLPGGYLIQLVVNGTARESKKLIVIR